MRHARVLGYVGLTAALAVAAVAFAQSTVTPVAPDAPVETKPLVEAKPTWGDVKRGAAKAGTCAACHGHAGGATHGPEDPGRAGPQAAFVERDARAGQALLLQRRNQRITVERPDEEDEIAAAAGSQQLAADRAIGFRQIIDRVEFGRTDERTQAALGVPRLVDQAAALQQLAAQQMMPDLPRHFLLPGGGRDGVAGFALLLLVAVNRA